MKRYTLRIILVAVLAVVITSAVFPATATTTAGTVLYGGEALIMEADYVGLTFDGDIPESLNGDGYLFVIGGPGGNPIDVWENDTGHPTTALYVGELTPAELVEVRTLVTSSRSDWGCSLRASRPAKGARGSSGLREVISNTSQRCWTVQGKWGQHEHYGILWKGSTERDVYDSPWYRTPSRIFGYLSSVCIPSHHWLNRWDTSADGMIRVGDNSSDYSEFRVGPKLSSVVRLDCE